MAAANEADYFQSIRTALSNPRFDSYRVNQGEADIQLLARHLWNQALGAALYPTLQFLELALRNAVNTAISNAYGTSWFDDPLVVVNVVYAQDRVRRAKQAVIDRTGYNPPSVNKVIAELDFGFWTSLFNHEYFAGRKRPANQKLLWPKLMPQVFTVTARAGRRPHDLSARFNNIRMLRNALSHHARIWLGRPPSAPKLARTPLNQEHQDLIEAIGWLNEDLRDTAVALDHFPDEYQNGFARALTQVEAYFRQVGYR